MTIRKKDVEIGAHYMAKISGNVVRVQITDVSHLGGWNARNTLTGRDVRIKSAQKLREKVA